MLRLLSILSVLLFVATTASAQTTISGTVCDAKSRKAVGSVNVMLQNTARRAMYGYAITKDDGTYSVTFNGKADTLVVVVTGFNIKEQTRTILSRSQRVDFTVESAALQIREVVIKAPAVTRHSDTLTYIVEKYADIADHAIGDVLKKMPGMEVAKSGEIKYNGKSINKFYVEGLDMLEGRYGIATNNIRAKDIASVQVFENHQPIKALKKLIDSDRAAINLKLKAEAKGTWNATMQLGAGYKPAMWNAEATAMFFGRKFQTINTYKTNNSGDDVSSELRSFYGGLDEASTLLGVHEPTTPSLDKERYLNNNIHTVSVNTITKLKKELEMTANAQYIHDYQTADGASVTTYYLPGQAPLIVSEMTSAAKRTDQTEVNLQLRSNTDKHYLLEKVTFSGRWDSDFGRVLNDDQPVDQRFRLPRITFSNQFTDIRRIGKWSVNFDSKTDYNTQPTTLRIRPMLYPELFGTPPDYPDAMQTLDSKRFRTNNSAFTAYSVKRWTFTIHAAANAQIEWMNSALSPMDASDATRPAVDTMRNDIYWRKLDLVVGPSVSYRIGDKFSISAYVPFDFMFLRTEDKVRQVSKNTNDVLINPSLTIQSALTYNLKFSARASYYESVGGLYDTYSGYIMTDYRMISSKDGDVSRNKSQNYSASLSYGNAIRALFGNIEVTYYRSRRNLMYGTTYIGSLSQIESVAIPNQSSGYNVSGKISKRFDGISTTFNLSGGFMRSWSDVLRQGEIMPTSFDRATAGFGFNTRFSQAVRLDYKAEYSRSQSHIEGGMPLDPIDVLRQDAAVNFIIKKKFICRIGGEHYYNAAIGGSDRNMFFLDAGLTYKTKKMEYSLEARNLLNTGVFSSASQSDITNYVYTYQLRPASVMFKIKFSLR
ncbi:MAG: TonB-dependent receptor [Alistipes sp.]